MTQINRGSPAQQQLDREAIAILRDMIIDNQQSKVPTPEETERSQPIMTELNRLKQAK